MVFFLVLRDDGAMTSSAACRLLVLHVPHQLLILLGAHSFTAGDRRTDVGQEQLQGDNFGHEMIRSDTGG